MLVQVSAISSSNRLIMKENTTTNAVSDSRRKVTLPEMFTESLQHETRYDYHWCSAVKILHGVGHWRRRYSLLLLSSIPVLATR